MKQIVQNLAGGKGEITRSTLKAEFGKLVLNPGSKIGAHSHEDKDGYRHCEIYFAFSPNIYVKGERRIVSICRNSSHWACNLSHTKKGKMFFLKLWW